MIFQTLILHLIDIIYGRYTPLPRMVLRLQKLFSYFLIKFQLHIWIRKVFLFIDKIFCCHGGISRWMTCRDNIRQIPRPPLIEKTKLLDCCLLADILWASPNATQSR